MNRPSLTRVIAVAIAATAVAATGLEAQTTTSAARTAVLPASLAAHTARAAAPRTAAPSIDDPAIVGIFDAANTWDINLGQLALKKSHNEKVRTFADMMVRDHSAVRKLGRDLAKKLNVTPTAPAKDFALSKDYVATRAKLQAESGAKFDKDYMDHEVWYHQAVIDAVTTTLLPATKNAELKALEVKVAPNFQAHLAAAKEIQQQLEK